jgi:hypothetical protein
MLREFRAHILLTFNFLYFGAIEKFTANTGVAGSAIFPE